MKKKSILYGALALVFVVLVVVCVWYFSEQSSKEPSDSDAVSTTGTYTYTASEKIVKPCFTLCEDGTFSMVFAPESSYIGIGSYTLENGRLTLNTGDGKFTYCFDALKGSFVFDADASSSLVWFSDISDGCVFEYTPSE